MPSFADLREQLDEIEQICSKHGASNVRVFGSVARGEARPNDIDFLVALERGRTYLDLAHLEMELVQLLGINVDILTDNGISPHLREQIIGEAVPL